MERLTDRIYKASPLCVQQIGVAAYGWWWYRRRFSPNFRRLVEEYRERDRWTADQFHSLQGKLLGSLFGEARRSSYYRRILQEARIEPGLSPWEALRRMPLLTKETLRSRAKDLLCRSPLPAGTIVHKSSGTTGTPSEIYSTREFHALELAIAEVRSLGWADVNSRERRVMFGVRKVCPHGQSQPPFWRYSPAEGLAYASVYHLSPRFIPSYLNFLRKFRPSIVMGYPSALATIARYALEHDDLPAPAKAVFTTSETVTIQCREAVEAAWRCRLHDRYGAVEGCVFASQCEHGRYHVSPEIGIVEILDGDGQPCALGQIGEVVCTGLQNTLQPLIRYRIGDAARWSAEGTCPCGRSMPILEAIDGRYEDICYTPDGREILRFDTVFKGITRIREAQVHQERINRFVVRVVPAPGFGPVEIERIRSNMRSHIGDVSTQVEIVDALERTASGKFRAVICDLQRPSLPVHSDQATTE